jgi:hypothetical protein
VSPITAQGIEAQRVVETEVDRASEAILSEVSGGPLSPSRLVSAISAAPDVVREAIWQLLDDGRVELTDERKIRRL